MRTPLLLLALACALPLSAQYSARQLTRNVAPQPAPPPVQRGAQQPGAVGVRPATPATAAQVQARKAQGDQNLIEFYKKRAEAGSSNAQYELGLRYVTGKGVEKDEKLARKWLQKAAQGGNRQADKKLEGFGWPKEDKKVEKPEPKEAPQPVAAKE